jgi:DNA-binding response OmpR family regulator
MAYILVIEDDTDIRNFVRVCLEKDGHQVIDAPNGRIGIELFRTCDVDLVITDMIMPEMEGVETILNIRSDRPDAKIIVISGGGPSLDASLCLMVGEMTGATRTLAKPFKLNDLIPVVRDVLAQGLNYQV